MRVAPVALVANSPHHAAELAVRSAEITHAHKHGQHGAACQAVAVYLALNSDPARPWTRIVELARRQSGPEHAAHALGNDVSALGSAPSPCWRSCDTDTIAAMTGAIVGARNGAGALHPAWTRRLA